MGATIVTPTAITTTGITQTTTMTQCSDCGERYKPNGQNFIRVINTKTEGQGDITFTVPAQHGGSNIGPITVADAGGDKTIALLEMYEYIDVDGYVNITYSGTLTSATTIGVFKLP